MNTPEIPVATYRLQFNRDFTFAKATEIIPYLAMLGISHIYASPYLKARPGSMHGYDIIDHNQLNPEIGTPEEFEKFVETLHQHGMGQILDIVPNHMGVMGADNAWWLDVLENGEASNYASFFDIDWQPLKDELQGKVLVPVLDDQYGTVLDKGDLKLVFDAEKGEFSVFFHQHRFPIDPKTYSVILSKQNDRLVSELGPDSHDLLELQSLISAFGHLPGQTESSVEKRAERNRDKEIHKRRLSALCMQSSAVLKFIQENVQALNGTPGGSRSFDELHELIKTQAFRLAYWRVASDDINYRRFFDINDLAGLRVENPQVFEATHRYVLELVRDGKVNGLRVDHPDGLFDPAQYFTKLQSVKPIYVVVEKILSGDEPIPSEWPVNGTTGYDFSNLVNGLFVDTTAAGKIRRMYRGFLAQSLEFRAVLYRCKKNVMRNALASELNVLASILSRIALSNRHTCDFTLNSLRNALSEVVANFPVYRTYLTEEAVSERDRWYIETALQAAKRQSKSQDASVFDFIRQVLLTRKDDAQSNGYRKAFITFSMKLQQFTSPVMAKGLEDTGFYRYHPLMSINDVGGNPLEFGVTPEEFHVKTSTRTTLWPHAMLATSTHDSKLSEDVRARINVLSEIPAQWRLKARQWRQMNQRFKTELDGQEMPSRNDEYLFYQILIGVWPAGSNLLGDELCERVKSYMLKAAREAKETTSWANQNQEYEKALNGFVSGVLNVSNHEFLADLSAFERRIISAGMMNSLSQALIKFTAPGVPDLYQGNELFELRLVDPDNRGRVDYLLRQTRLCDLISVPCKERNNQVRKMASTIVDGADYEGNAKLFLTWRALTVRRQHLTLFRDGQYLPLTVKGALSRHIIAFARKNNHAEAIVVAPRLCAELLANESSVVDANFWKGTYIELPNMLSATRYQNCFSYSLCSVTKGKSGVRTIKIDDLFKDFPWALLTIEDIPAQSS
ncbi:MAG TPA: malto-oligosyltrehalose synthase [Terriglobales bacterium]